jgi:hypothetical protein
LKGLLCTCYGFWCRQGHFLNTCMPRKCDDKGR